MDAPSKYKESINLIMQNFRELKSGHTQLEQDYKELELAYTKLKQRFGDSERNRNLLIKLLNDKVEKVQGYRENNLLLQNEISHLNSTVQDQNSLINGYLSTIEQLKRENALLKSKRKEPSNVIERGTLQSSPINHLNGINGTHYSHPSFDATTSEVKMKKKKKSPLAFQNRYSNLDISVNGTKKKEDSPEEKSKNGGGKKRRLFSLEDDMIDLTIDNQE